MKKKVLEIEITRINEEYSTAYISYQDFNVLKRCEFTDNLIGVSSASYPEYKHDENKLLIIGSDEEQDNRPFVVKNEFLTIIKDKVDSINEIYGIETKWRAESGGVYCYITHSGNIEDSFDIRSSFDDELWRCNNYFRTELDAISSSLFNAFIEMKENGGK